MGYLSYAEGEIIRALDRGGSRILYRIITVTSMTEGTKVLEEPVSYCKKHYPDGLNKDFKTDDVFALTEKYAGPNGLFTNPEVRDIAGNVTQIMEALGDLSNHIVADIGAGTGLFTTALDQAVAPDGKVYTNEISEGFLIMLRDEVQKEGLTRTHVVQGSELSTGIPVEPGALDLVFLCDVYHHIERPITYMSTVRSLMEKGGRLAVIDFHRDDDRIKSHERGWVMEHVRADQATFTSEIQQAGFVLQKEIVIETLIENYFLIFENPL